MEVSGRSDKLSFNALLVGDGVGGNAYVNYAKDLFSRLPSVKKKFLELEGSVFWMCSHPKVAAQVICEWVDEIL